MNIIVTGASRGIGYETVKILAADPAHKIIAIARNRQQLEKLKNECELFQGGNVFIMVSDLAEHGAQEKLVSEIKNRFKSVDILVNNAGMILNKSIQEISDAEIEQVYRVNVFSVFRLIRDLIPLLKKEKARSHVVNISSMGGVQGSIKFSGLSAYSSSKGAVAVLTECMAEELKTFNISVNCLALGAVQTEMLEAAFPGYQASCTAVQMAGYLVDFALKGQENFNGKVLQVSSSTP